MKDWRNNFIYLVENGNTKDIDEDGEFLWDKIEKGNYLDFLFKMSIVLEVPELHISWKISVKLFKLILNILDKMKVNIYFIVDVEYLLNEENSFEEILKELNYRLNFKIDSESIVYKFRNNIKNNITKTQLNLFNQIYTEMISNDWNIFILDLILLNSCLLDKLLKTNEEISVNVYNSEEMSSGKKKIIYYKQWLFIIDNDKELKIIEGLPYGNFNIKKLILLIRMLTNLDFLI